MHYTKNGLFIVKSAYFLYKSIQASRASGSSQGNPHHDAWNLIWKLIVPKGGKMFMLRVCKSILPTFVNLKKIKIVENIALVLFVQYTLGLSAMFFRVVK